MENNNKQKFFDISTTSFIKDDDDSEDLGQENSNNTQIKPAHHHVPDEPLSSQHQQEPNNNTIFFVASPIAKAPTTNQENLTEPFELPTTPSSLIGADDNLLLDNNQQQQQSPKKQATPLSATTISQPSLKFDLIFEPISTPPQSPSEKATTTRATTSEINQSSELLIVEDEEDRAFSAQSNNKNNNNVSSKQEKHHLHSLIHTMTLEMQQSEPTTTNNNNGNDKWESEETAIYSMANSGISPITVEVYDPDALWSFVEASIVERMEKSHLKNIVFHSSKTLLFPPTLPTGVLYQQAYLFICIIKCESLKDYLNSTKARLKGFVEDVTARSPAQYMIIFVETVKESKKVYAKLESEFNKERVCMASVFDYHTTSASSSSVIAASPALPRMARDGLWGDICRRILKFVKMCYEERLMVFQEVYDAYVGKREEFTIGGFFDCLENLSFSALQMNEWANALWFYEEAGKFIKKLLVEEKHSQVVRMNERGVSPQFYFARSSLRKKNVFEAFAASLLDVDKLNYRELLTSNQISMIELQTYLFARKSLLLYALHRPIEVLRDFLLNYLPLFHFTDYKCIFILACSLELVATSHASAIGKNISSENRVILCLYQAMVLERGYASLMQFEQNSDIVNKNLFLPESFAMAMGKNVKQGMNEEEEEEEEHGLAFRLFLSRFLEAIALHFISGGRFRTGALFVRKRAEITNDVNLYQDAARFCVDWPKLYALSLMKTKKFDLKCVGIIDKLIKLGETDTAEQLSNLMMTVALDEFNENGNIVPLNVVVGAGPAVEEEKEQGVFYLSEHHVNRMGFEFVFQAGKHKMEDRFEKLFFGEEINQLVERIHFSLENTVGDVVMAVSEGNDLLSRTFVFKFNGANIGKCCDVYFPPRDRLVAIELVGRTNKKVVYGTLFAKPVRFLFTKEGGNNALLRLNHNIPKTVVKGLIEETTDMDGWTKKKPTASRLQHLIHAIPVTLSFDSLNDFVLDFKQEAIGRGGVLCIKSLSKDVLLMDSDGVTLNMIRIENFKLRESFSFSMKPMMEGTSGNDNRVLSIEYLVDWEIKYVETFCVDFVFPLCVKQKCIASNEEVLLCFDFYRNAAQEQVKPHEMQIASLVINNPTTNRTLDCPASSFGVFPVSVENHVYFSFFVENNTFEKLQKRTEGGKSLVLLNASIQLQPTKNSVFENVEIGWDIPLLFSYMKVKAGKGSGNANNNSHAFERKVYVGTNFEEEEEEDDDENNKIDVGESVLVTPTTTSDSLDSSGKTLKNRNPTSEEDTEILDAMLETARNTQGYYVV